MIEESVAYIRADEKVAELTLRSIVLPIWR